MSQLPINIAQRYKDLETSELLTMFSDVFPSKILRTTPFHHQLVSLVWALDQNFRRIMLWHDIGTGKTLIALYLSALWHAKTTLVVCPKSVMRTWKEQIEEHTNFNSVELIGTSDARKRKAKSEVAFHIINYEGLKSLLGRKVTEYYAGTKKNKWVVDKEALEKTSYSCIIFDESHHVANPQALQTEIAAELSEKATHVICLTGTPISRDEGDLWAQFRVLDGGKTFGKNYWTFRNEHYIKRGPIWFIRKGSRKIILDAIVPSTLRYEASECIDLPELIEEKRSVILSPQQEKVYNRILNGLRVDLEKGELSGKTVELRAQKLVQVASGFLINDFGDIEILPGQNGKIDALRGILRATATIGRKILVCHCFQQEGRFIEELCRKMKLKYASLRGEISTKDKEIHYKRFTQSKDTNVLIFHPKSAGEGLNLQMASHITFFSIGFLGAIFRQQAIGRILRQGQNKTCTVYDIITIDTIEENMYKGLSERVDLSRRILAYVSGKK